jgi:UDP-2,3-diacylglucosamine hydrolase
MLDPSTPPAPAPSKAPVRIGLMAGWGRYPLLVVEALRRQGSQVFCLGVVGHADPKLAEICQDFQWSGLARFGAAIRYFKRHQVTDVIMAGKIHKVVLFQPWMIVRNMPDLRTYRMFIPHFLTRKKDCKDDTLLGAIVQEFAREGMRFGRPTDYAAELLVSKGQLTRRGPTAWQWKDIHFGWKLAKEMGRLDVGQSVAVKDQAVLAVEAVEGTDQCICRAGALCRAGGFTLVKVAKPQQDMRYDVPTVGMRTVENIASSGGRVLAVEAGRTILLDGPDVIDFADRHGLVIVSIDDETN